MKQYKDIPILKIAKDAIDREVEDLRHKIISKMDSLGISAEQKASLRSNLLNLCSHSFHIGRSQNLMETLEIKTLLMEEGAKETLALHQEKISDIYGALSPLVIDLVEKADEQQEFWALVLNLMTKANIQGRYHNAMDLQEPNDDSSFFNILGRGF
ncbi:hypothetical protein ACFSCX_15695 [Bacillus salitolerans]|uniref:Flagellar protein FlgN n=1 Tax=Bacillus salitolerans TaxID=1437434 RepID=A0ABW4LV20_9BACI